MDNVVLGAPVVASTSGCSTSDQLLTFLTSERESLLTDLSEASQWLTTFESKTPTTNSPSNTGGAPENQDRTAQQENVTVHLNSPPSPVPSLPPPSNSLLSPTNPKLHHHPQTPSAFPFNGGGGYEIGRLD